MSSILRKFKHRKDTEDSDKTAFMMRNGETILKELIASSNGKYNPYRIFSVKELKLATNNYDQQNIILEDPYRKLYKGFWQEHSISVMKYDNNINQYAHEWCINHIVYAAQMNHKHILKLIGCCLETEIPILVFEYVEYGTLDDRIHGTPQPYFEPLLLTHRLKIAMDKAHAVAYLHVGFPRPIVFRDMKPSNILFNEQNVAKLFDFSLSLSIPDGETHIELDHVVGTIGFIAPEYFTTSKCNEKCDVYGFGAFLFELLSSQKVSGPGRVESRLDYDKYVKKLFEENRFKEIVDPITIEDRSCIEKEQQLQAVRQLIIKCMDLSPEDRPTMVDVAKQLRQMYRSSM